MPPGLRHAYWFAAFNALSFPIVLSNPMILYGKTLGAGATVLGIIAGMMPLLVIFQIPAANYVARVGYKRFVYAGWGTRVMFIFAMALVPLTGGFLDATTRLALLLLLLFCFNLSRGISSCAWLPWITTLVPSDRRGRYLAQDAACQNLSSFLTFVIAALVLGEAPQPGRFAVIFAFSAVMGAVSLGFLKRIPDVPIPEATRTSRTPVPWLAMARYEPFRRLLWAAAAWSVAYGGVTAFTVAYLKSSAGMGEGRILLVTSVMYLGGLSSLWLLGARLDRLGSKPVLLVALGFWLLILGGWLLLAGGGWPTTLPVILSLEVLMGLFSAVVTMAFMRLAMGVIPEMGRSHFFALYSVITSVSLGLAPIGWGLMIDAVGGWRARAGGLEWNRFTLFFAAANATLLIALGLTRRLHEPTAAGMAAVLREIKVPSPGRIWRKLRPRQ